MFEAMLRASADQRGIDLDVSSGGFLYNGESVSPTVLEVMAERGVDLTSHRSRIVDSGMITGVDLVLTMERRHARELVVMRPEAFERVHTVVGFVATLSALDPPPGHGEPPASIVMRVSVDNRRDDLLGVGDDDVPDPHGRHRDAYLETTENLQEMAVSVVDGLFPR